jgi:hypothetical protein
LLTFACLLLLRCLLTAAVWLTLLLPAAGGMLLPACLPVACGCCYDKSSRS